jgi:hypothetical protein
MQHAGIGQLRLPSGAVSLRLPGSAAHYFQELPTRVASTSSACTTVAGAHGLQPQSARTAGCLVMAAWSVGRGHGRSEPLACPLRLSGMEALGPRPRSNGVTNCEVVHLGHSTVGLASTQFEFHDMA